MIKTQLRMINMMKRIRAATMAMVPMLPPARATGIRWGEVIVGNECLLLWIRRLLFSCRMIALASTWIATLRFVACLSTTIASGLMEKMGLRAAIIRQLNSSLLIHHKRHSLPTMTSPHLMPVALAGGSIGTIAIVAALILFIILIIRR